MAKEKKEEAAHGMATQEPAGLVTREELPAHLKGKEGQGSENVGMKNLTIPRLAILQKQSPQLDESMSNYIHGAKEGDIINTLTQDNYGKSVVVVDAFFREEWMVAVPQNDGGGGGKGFRGIFPTQQEARDYIRLGNTKKEKLEVVELGVHYCLLLDEHDQVITMIAVPMKSSQLKVSRQLNGFIKHKGGPQWAAKWKLETIGEVNSGNKPYKNYKVLPLPGWASEELAEKAEALWKSVASMKAEMHMGDFDTSDETAPAGTEDEAF